MAADIIVDKKEVEENLAKLLKRVGKAKIKAMEDVANEILRLSSFEVPHDKGLLQSSGGYEPGDETIIVGYNKKYAARLHEHPEFHFQKGRKGKYLEDPIKRNTKVLLRYMGEGLKIEMGFK